MQAGFPSPNPKISRPDMFTFLLVLQAVIAAVLVTLILTQRSEGGGLGGASLIEETSSVIWAFCGLACLNRTGTI